MEITITTYSSPKLSIPDEPSVTEFKRVLSELQRPFRIKCDYLNIDGEPITAISQLVNSLAVEIDKSMTKTWSAPAVYFEAVGMFTRK
jgi:hypothetical protein